MTIIAVLSVFAGMLTGIRFRLLAIMPVIIAAMLAAAAVTAAQGAPLWSVLAASVLSAIGAQVGYLCGSFAPSLKDAPEIAPARATSLPLDVRAPSAK